MKRRLQVLALLMIAAATPAAAAPAAAKDHRVELVPWIGVRGGAKLDADTSPAPPAEAGPSGSLGFGVLVSVQADGWFEVRGYATINDAAISVACGPGCFVQFGADGWYQLAARAGPAIRI